MRQPKKLIVGAGSYGVASAAISSAAFQRIEDETDEREERLRELLAQRAAEPKDGVLVPFNPEATADLQLAKADEKPSEFEPTLETDEIYLILAQAEAAEQEEVSPLLPGLGILEYPKIENGDNVPSDPPID